MTFMGAVFLVVFKSNIKILYLQMIEPISIFAATL